MRSWMCCLEQEGKENLAKKKHEHQTCTDRGEERKSRELHLPLRERGKRKEEKKASWIEAVFPDKRKEKKRRNLRPPLLRGGAEGRGLFSS